MKKNSHNKIFENRINTLRSNLKESSIDLAMITDDDNIYYYTGYYDYLHMEFGRPTILIVPKEDKTILITPSVDAGLAEDEGTVDNPQPGGVAEEPDEGDLVDDRQGERHQHQHQDQQPQGHLPGARGKQRRLCLVRGVETWPTPHRAVRSFRDAVGVIPGVPPGCRRARRAGPAGRRASRGRG